MCANACENKLSGTGSGRLYPWGAACQSCCRWRSSGGIWTKHWARRGQCRPGCCIIERIFILSGRRSPKRLCPDGARRHLTPPPTALSPHTGRPMPCCPLAPVGSPHRAFTSGWGTQWDTQLMLLSEILHRMYERAGGHCIWMVSAPVGTAFGCPRRIRNPDIHLLHPCSILRTSSCCHVIVECDDPAGGRLCVGVVSCGSPGGVCVVHSARCIWILAAFDACNALWCTLSRSRQGLCVISEARAPGELECL